MEPLELELELGWGVGMGTTVVNAVPWLNQHDLLVLLFKGSSIDPEIKKKRDTVKGVMD